jgi:AcrR family transcriptional regulator
LQEDPRVLRTRRRLRQALLELIAEVGYEGITVDLLAGRADVARSTFYSHYSAKEDLLFDGFGAWLLSFSELDRPAPGEPFRYRFSLPLLRHAATQRKFFKETIIRGPSDRVRRRLRDILTEVVLAELSANESEHAAGPEGTGRARAVAGAFLAVAAWWLEEARTLTPEEVDVVFQNAVTGAA